jgi:hypothetical protein
MEKAGKNLNISNDFVGNITGEICHNRGDFDIDLE